MGSVDNWSCRCLCSRLTIPDESTLWTIGAGPGDDEIFCIERFDSRPLSISRDPTASLIFSLWRSDDEFRIASQLEDTAPALFGGLDADSYTLDPQGGGVWLAHVNCKIRNQSSESFDTTGGTVHVCDDATAGR